MSEHAGRLSLGDMVVGLIAELQERVQLEGEARRIVLMAVALAANNGRLIGMDEVLAQAAEQGLSVEVAADAVDAPATLTQALGG
ncbi:MAG: hypothetical protein JWM31_8 [Solirubrobacterales bacterium]|nr:hypothetical protein [Solirubrobacterales bacterium]